MNNINFASANSTFDNLDLYALSSTKEEMDTRKVNIKMDNINFTSANPTFDNLDLYVLSSTKEEMDARKDLDVYRRNGAEEQNCKESLQSISSAIQEQSNFQQPQCSTTNGCKSEWNHDYHNYPMGCSMLPLHNQLSLPKGRPQDKKNEIHISEPGEIPFSASQPNLLMDNYNRQLQKFFNNNQCLLEIELRKNYRRCIWCVSFSLHRAKKEDFCCNQSNERLIPFFSEPEWKCDPILRNVNIQELRGDECLDHFMSVQTRSPNQVSNSIYSERRNSVAMQELSSLPELFESIKNDHEYREFHKDKDKWLIDQEYFSDTYGITKICPLLIDRYGGSFMFLDSRDILFEWSEMTQSMYILGINIIEGLANFLYHPEKRCIIEVDGKLILYEELKRQAIEEAAKIKIIKA
ncbi:hypothetical protein C1645_734230 [Glomus cerebriforme]|uniref:Uncharacterized protein n=1 Tax=Glomus cerebriforme TaxID=658196 RepID=A0A397TK63_9GLOM|nr:hypothetical protein C1645_734230 [Glomus cerebriforme]